MRAWDEFAGRERGDGGGNIVNFPLQAFPARLPDATRIPPREWLYGTRLIRRFVTVLVASGGSGKSSHSICVAIELASGVAILGEKIHHQVNSWLLSLEDPLDETDRRIAAVMLRHRIGRDQLADRLYVNCGREERIVIAKLEADGYTITYPHKAAMIAAIKEHDIGYVNVDPFVRSHELEENRNEHMNAAAAAWAEIADETGAAIELVHHTRKGGVPTEMIEAARGGKALTDAARVGQVMLTMSIEEAAKFGVKETDRWSYVRLADAKVNMAPRGEGAKWMRLEMVDLGNTTPEYPAGDRVAAVALWSPPSVWEGLSMADAVAVLTEIDNGPGEGEFYAAGPKVQHGPRWAGNVLTRRTGMAEERAAPILNEWLHAGALVQTTYHSPSQRRERGCVRVDQAKLAEMQRVIISLNDDA